jgi:hypothetical protein
MLALAKLKNVAISLRNREGGKEGGRVLETGKKRGWEKVRFQEKHGGGLLGSLSLVRDASFLGSRCPKP